MAPEKKISISIVLALAAILQSFLSKPSDSGIYYWFNLTSDYVRSGPPPATVKNKDISHGYSMVSLTTLIPDPGYTGCYGNSYYCMACFTANQLTTAHNYLKTTFILSQIPANAGSTK